MKKLIGVLLACCIATPSFAFVSEWEYKVAKKVLKETYEKQKYKDSGYLLMEDYLEKSNQPDVTSLPVPEPKTVKPSNMKYVPQPTYGIKKYNSPPGTAEINLYRKFKFDRQQNAQGITSPDKKLLVYPSVHYYARPNNVTCDVYVIPLDMSLNARDRILRANVVKRLPNPIFSTDKDTSVNHVFRTITPVDFSSDSTIVLAKEKTGYNFDGIWKTELLTYDFTTKTARRLPQVRDAIIYHWRNSYDINLREKRWDIYPLGFEVDNPHSILVNAYAYTGRRPKFLGTWRIDYKGEKTELVSLSQGNQNVSMNGFKLYQDGVVDKDSVDAEEKRLEKLDKKKAKLAKKKAKQIEKERKKVYEQELKNLKKQFNEEKKEFKKEQRKGNYPTS